MSTSNDFEKISRLEDAERNVKLRLLAHQKEYNIWTKTKADMVKEWDVIKADLYPLQEKDIRDIAGDIITEMGELGCAEGGTWNVYKIIPDEHKQENVKQLFKRYALEDSKDKKINTSVEEEIMEDVKAIEEKLEKLPASRRAKILDQVKEFVKEEGSVEWDEVKEEDFGVHQHEPPEDMQGPSEFSEAVRFTARWFAAVSKHYNKIADEIETYKPQNPDRIAQQAKDWNECINGTIIRDILNPIFIEETAAEADRKYSTSKFHWIGIIKNRIEQSKHGAGKMAENYIVDPFGHIVYNKKLKPIKKSISRERVGDYEWPIVDEAERLIKANAGLYQLHDWLENDQGGYRRYRKEFLHDYFAEASMGSIKSGNPEYKQFMRDYKKKQLEKFSSADK